jgi:hypothetical protein
MGLSASRARHRGKRRVLTPEQFLEFAQPNFLTVADVLKFPLGVPQEILFFDRNFYDLISEDLRPLPPSQFLKRNYWVKFTREHGLEGRWEWEKGRLDPTGERQFDVLKRGLWRPLHRDSSPDPNLQIGWRGPAVLGKWVRNVPILLQN